MIVLNVHTKSFPVLGVRQIFQVPNQNCAVCVLREEKEVVMRKDMRNRLLGWCVGEVHMKEVLLNQQECVN